MKCFRRVHVRHDLVAGLHEVIRGRFSRDFCQSKVRFRIDKSRIDCHPSHIDQLCSAWNIDRTCGTNRSNLSALHHDDAVLNRSVCNGKNLATLKHDGLVLCLGGAAKKSVHGEGQRARTRGS